MGPYDISRPLWFNIMCYMVWAYSFVVPYFLVLIINSYFSGLLHWHRNIYNPSPVIISFPTRVYEAIMKNVSNTDHSKMQITNFVSDHLRIIVFMVHILHHWPKLFVSRYNNLYIILYFHSVLLATYFWILINSWYHNMYWDMYH